MGRLSKTGGKTVKKHWGNWNGGENDVELNYGNGKAMGKKCGFDVRPLAMEKQ